MLLKREPLATSQKTYMLLKREALATSQKSYTVLYSEERTACYQKEHFLILEGEPLATS